MQHHSSLKSYLFLFLVFLITQETYSQQTETSNKGYIFIDKKGESVPEKSATYLIAVTKSNDTNWKFELYNILGPLINTGNYKDKARTIKHGTFTYYNEKGFIDSLQQYENGLANGKWFYFTDTGKIYMRKDFQNGICTKQVDFLEEKSLIPDTTGYIEPEFSGGPKAWNKFLVKNFRYPGRAIDNRSQGTVIISFTIDEEGNTSELIPTKSVECTIDQEAMRVISISPKWIPATKDGIKVKSFKKLPLTFRLDRG